MSTLKMKNDLNLPSLYGTNIEIPPLCPDKTKAEKIKEAEQLVKSHPSNLKLTHKYLWTPHLTWLKEKDRIEIEKITPREMIPHDNWARIPYQNYQIIAAPQKIYQKSLSHEYFSEPYHGRLKPFIYP